VIVKRSRKKAETCNFSHGKCTQLEETTCQSKRRAQRRNTLLKTAKVTPCPVIESPRDTKQYKSMEEWLMQREREKEKKTRHVTSTELIDLTASGSMDIHMRIRKNDERQQGGRSLHASRKKLRAGLTKGA
jgi:hypothetical protein